MKYWRPGGNIELFAVFGERQRHESVRGSAVALDAEAVDKAVARHQHPESIEVIVRRRTDRIDEVETVVVVRTVEEIFCTRY